MQIKESATFVIVKKRRTEEVELRQEVSLFCITFIITIIIMH